MPNQDPPSTDSADGQKESLNQPHAAEEGAEAPANLRRRLAAEDGEEEELGGRMSFLEHLDELRRRIIQSALAVLVTFALSFVFREQIFEFFQKPIMDVLAKQGIEKLIFTKPTDAFTIYLKVCFASGIFFAAPVLAWQVWLFIAPGLYRREKMFAIPFLFSSTMLFLAGGALAYLLILPTGLDFLVNQMGEKFLPMLTAVDYFNFALIVLVGMGVVFQMPVLVAFLSLFGLISPGFLWRNFRYALLIIVIVAAVVSPTPDALNLFFWVAPMVVLYFVSIVVSWVFGRRRKKKLAEEGVL